MIKGIFEILMLVTAVSMDAFAAAFAYGMSKIKMPILSVIIVSGISAITLWVSLLAGRLVRGFLPEGFPGEMGFIILFVLGIVKLFDRAGKKEAEEANRDGDNLLSALEAVTLGAALSLDSVAAGIGAGIMTIHVLGTVLATLLINTLMMFAGSRLGTAVAGKSQTNLSWISGVLLMALAFLRLL